MAMVTVRQAQDKTGGFVAEFSGWNVRTFARGRTIGAAIDTLFSSREMPACAQNYKHIIVAKFSAYRDWDWVIGVKSLPYTASMFPVQM